VLDDFATIQVAECYELNGRRSDRFPSSTTALERCRPVWRSFPGWKTSTAGVRRWEDLPGLARGYLEWVEAEAGVPITVVSVGAEREAEIRRGVPVR
jgi:adenylosuccinate synthase